jgi:Family of unknown function (DUF6499)
MPYESDWRAATAYIYTYLDDFGSMAFAWELVRRNSAYRAAYFSIASGDDAASEMSERIAQRGGLRFRGRPQPGRRSCSCRVAAAPQSCHCDCRASPS